MTAVGWIGFGAMGAPMAARIASAGHTLHAAPRSDSQRQLLLEFGGVEHPILAEVARASEVICSIVPGPKDVLEVWTSHDGLLAGCDPGTIAIEMSTVGVETIRKIAGAAEKRAVDLIDAPVSGGVNGAATGSLAIFAGGSANAIQRAQEVLSSLGTVHSTGVAGSGQIMKLVNQALVSANTFGLCLGWALAARNGLDPQVTLNALTNGAADGRLLRLEWPMLIDRDLRSGFAASHMTKDLTLLREFCQRSDVEIGVVDELLQAFRTLADNTPPLTATQALGEQLAGTLTRAPAAEPLDDLKELR